MFWNATSFNQPLNNWNVSNVEDIRLMFDVSCSPFGADISTAREASFAHPMDHLQNVVRTQSREDVVVLQGGHELLLFTLRFRFGVKRLVVVGARHRPELRVRDDGLALLLAGEEVARHRCLAACVRGGAFLVCLRARRRAVS